MSAVTPGTDEACLVISVRLHDARYHGAGEWPPAPARLFQALLAGAARGRNVAREDLAALAWLEAQAAPVIVAPPQTEGQEVSMFVPNNDLDAVAGDVRRIGTIRTQKTVKPRLLPESPEIVYAWTIGTEAEALAERVTVIAEQVYQLGRGPDMAWAVGEIVDAAGAAERLWRYEADGGRVYRPGAGEGEVALACPQVGSLASLQARFTAFLERFKQVGSAKKAVTLFTQPPKARFQQVAYACVDTVRIYELQRSEDTAFEAWPLARAHDLVTTVRDGAFARLVDAMPWAKDMLEAALIGRGAAASAKTRVRIVPLPSVGHPEADPAIRRVLVVTPADCTIDAGDVHWACSGLELPGRVLTPSEDDTMLAHYGKDGARRWRTVTAAALPEQSARRRIEPTRRTAESKGGAERAAEEGRAVWAVAQALRHAGIGVRATRIVVQREPLDKRGERAEAFADETRFAKERLWHVEVELERAVRGPLVLGDGRFLGLGVMRALREPEEIAVFEVAGDVDEVDVETLARSVRRAVMARVGDIVKADKRWRGARLPSVLSGHEGDEPAQGHEHLAYVYDAARRRVLVVAPPALRRRDVAALSLLERGLEGLAEVSLGPERVMRVTRRALDVDSDPLLMAACVWESLTPYVVTRHEQAWTVAEAIAGDVQRECARTGLPVPRIVDVLEWAKDSERGLSARVRLTFAQAQVGPMLLGRTRHLGGGVFGAVE